MFQVRYSLYQGKRERDRHRIKEGALPSTSKERGGGENAEYTTGETATGKIRTSDGA